MSTSSMPAKHADNHHTYRLDSERFGANPCEWPDCTQAATIATDQPGIPWGQLLLCDVHAWETQVDDIDATGDSAFVRQLAKNLASAVRDADDTVWAKIGRAMLGRAIEQPSSMFVSDIDVVSSATGAPLGLLLFGDES